MNFYHLTALILTLAIAIAYINLRFVKMPMTIAIMFASLLISIGLIIADRLGFHELKIKVASLAGKINFHDFLMQGILSYLLFAGALTIDLSHLKNKKWEIGILASLGTVASTLLVSLMIYYFLGILQIKLDFAYCLLFGALISPTDPIAVLSIFKSLKAPQKLSILLEGESLFNDGVGIVIFMTIYALVFNGVTPTFQTVTFLFLQQAIGGIIYGLCLGWLALKLMKNVFVHEMIILITLAIASGGYALAEVLKVSGPLAMVVAGIMIGNRQSVIAENLSMHQREYLEIFWGLVDEILNAILFLLIGFELLLVDFTGKVLLAGLFAIPLVLFVRFICVAIPLSFFKQKMTHYSSMIFLLTWGGLRGGLAVALVLALPMGDYRNLLLTMTYATVVFAILIQGMTVKPLILRCMSEK